MDFPGLQQTPHIITSYQPVMSGLARSAQAFTNPASMAWGGANTAAFIPFHLPFPYPVSRVFWCNGSAIVSNIEVGIYTSGGAKLWSSGSVAQAGASNLQFVTVTPTLLLSPGSYYIALTCSGTTNAILGSVGVTAIAGRFVGLYQQAVAPGALPLSWTPAQWAMIGYPLVGITRTSTGL